MKNEFTERELGECLELVIDHRGKTPKKLGADWIDSGVPTISAKNVNGGRLVATDDIRHVSHDVYKRWMKEDVKRGDCFLVSEGATLGECMLWDYDYPVVLGQRIFCLRANPSVLYPRYLYAYMTSASFQSEIIGRATGTSVDGLRQTEVLKLKLRLPPLSQQKHIGDTLYNLDKKIELNRRMNATLEAMARALFQSWFVDFDPVRAKLDGRKLMGLDEATAALFPATFQETELGHIPNGWEVKAVGEVVELAYGKPLKAQARKNGPICVYGANGQVGWHDEKLVSGPGIVVGRKGNPGVVTWAHGDFYPIDTTFYVERTGQCESLYFLYYALSLHNLANLSADSAVPGLNRNHAYISKQVTPPPPVLTAFDSQIGPIFAAIHANEEESRTLATLRDTLLPKLLSGELSVSEGPTKTSHGSEL
jgi:type I restriction enzyme, S subunit